MGAQDIQEQNGAAQGVAGQVRRAESFAQLASFLFPSCNLKVREERKRKHHQFVENLGRKTSSWSKGLIPPE